MTTGTAPARSLILATLATWRVTHLLVNEDGPGEVVVRLRRRAGSGWAGALMDCFYCMSFWVAVVVVSTVTRSRRPAPVLWLSVSGARVPPRASHPTRHSRTRQPSDQRGDRTPMSCCGQKRQMIVRSRFAEAATEGRSGRTSSGDGALGPTRTVRGGSAGGSGSAVRGGSAVRSLLARKAFAARRRSSLLNGEIVCTRRHLRASIHRAFARSGTPGRS